MEQNLYKKLIKRKNNGEKLIWDQITREELEELFEKSSDNMIAELYGVSKSQVKTKREKWNIKQINYTIKSLLTNNTTLFKPLNNTPKENLLNENNINTISIALTHYLFRNGPVEDIHSAGKLSQDDMKTLNKFMVNRIAGLLKTINTGDWLKLELLLNYYKLFGKEWDKPIADTDEINAIYSNFVQSIDNLNKKQSS